MYKTKKTDYQKQLDQLKERMKSEKRLLKFEELYRKNLLKGFSGKVLIDKNFYKSQGDKDYQIDKLLHDNQFEIIEALRLISFNLNDINLKISRSANLEKIVITDLITNEILYSKDRQIGNGSSESDLDVNLVALWLKDKLTRLLLKPGFGSSVLKTIRKI